MGPVKPTSGPWHEAQDWFRFIERFSSKNIDSPNCSYGKRSLAWANKNPNDDAKRVNAKEINATFTVIFVFTSNLLSWYNKFYYSVLAFNPVQSVPNRTAPTVSIKGGIRYKYHILIFARIMLTYAFLWFINNSKSLSALDSLSVVVSGKKIP